MVATTAPTVDRAMVLRALDLLAGDGVVELRMLGPGKGNTASGYYDADHRDDLVDAADRLSRRGGAAYVTLNKVDPRCHARAYNRMKERADQTTSDTEITRRTRLGIDIDAKRPAGVSSTADEHRRALALADEIRAFLREQGWPDPLYGSSGNGGSLVYGIDLPNDQASTDLIKRVLATLAARFTDGEVKVDESVFNLARIWRLYGTPNVKGDSTPDQPHRLAEIIEAPDELEPVTREQLEALTGQGDTGDEGADDPIWVVNAGDFDIDAWIAKYNLDVRDPEEYQGGRRWKFNNCPFNDAHQGQCAALIQYSRGGLYVKCLHETCRGKGWRDLRAKYEPGGVLHVNGRKPEGGREGGQGGHTPTVGTLRENLGTLGDRLAPFVLVRMADVTPKRVRWLWPRRIPLGKITVIDGDPGLGKSTMMLNIAARVSLGTAMPDGAVGDLEEPAGVVVLSAEDGLEDTLRPRLEVAGADLARVFVLPAVRDAEGERLPTLADITQIEAAARAVEAKLIIIDPVMAYLGADTNSYRDQDIRRLLAPLAALAERLGAAIVIVRHLNKAQGGSAIYRGGGSIGIIGAARSGLLVGKDPENDDRRILVGVKHNLSRTPDALAYHIEEVGSDETSHIVWEGVTSHTADGLLAAPRDADEASALYGAKQVLRDLLSDGPADAKTVETECRAAGVSTRTYRRARSALGVLATKTGFDGGWELSLPTRELPPRRVPSEAEECQENPKSAKDAKDGDLGPLGDRGGDSLPAEPPDAFAIAHAAGYPRVMLPDSRVIQGQGEWAVFIGSVNDEDRRAEVERLLTRPPNVTAREWVAAMGMAEVSA